ETANEAKKYLEDKKKELLIAQEERKKLEKQAKTNKKIKVPDPIDEKKYTYLSRGIMLQLFRNRLAQPDCGVGVVFDNFRNSYVENEEELMEIIDELLEKEHLI